MASATPEAFSAEPPGLLHGRASGRFFFAYNLDNPSGIKLLGSEAYDRLQHLIRTSSQPVPNTEGSEVHDLALHAHGLIKRKSSYASVRKPDADSTKSLSVWLSVTDACNLGCHYCYIPELKKHVNPGSFAAGSSGITPETISQVVDKLVSFCEKNQLSTLHIKFAGGEPTLAIQQVDQFSRSLKTHAGGLGLRFGMLTNGVFRSESVVPIIAEHDIKVSISLDGYGEHHNRIRYTRGDGGRIGTWETIIRNLEALRLVGARPFFLYTITNKNLHDIQKFASFVHSLNLGFRLSLERALKPIDQATQSEVARYLQRFYTELAQQAPLNIRFDRAAKFAEWALDRKKTLACSSCRGYIAIGPDARVASCQMRLNEPVGSLATDTVGECLSGFDQDVRTRLLRHPSERDGACTRCEFRFTCAGGCPQHTRDVHQTINHPSPWCFVYGSLLPTYVRANAIHLARRAEALSSKLSS